MANTALTVTSERAGLAVLSATVSNIDSATSLNEQFTMPVGFGDSMIYGVAVMWAGLQTIVTMTPARGPAVWLFTNSIKDFVNMRPWVRSANGGLSLAATDALVRPVLWRQEESLLFQALDEDTGAGDTSDVTAVVRVLRLRNLGG